MDSANWGSGASLRWDVWIQERWKRTDVSDRWIMWAAVLLLGLGVWRRCPLSLPVKSTGYCFHCVGNQNLSLSYSLSFYLFLSCSLTLQVVGLLGLVTGDKSKERSEYSTETWWKHLLLNRYPALMGLYNTMACYTNAERVLWPWFEINMAVTLKESSLLRLEFQSQWLASWLCFGWRFHLDLLEIRLDYYEGFHGIVVVEETFC